MALLLRLYEDGSLKWLEYARGGSPDRLVLLDDGGAVMTGRFQGTMTFAEGAVEETILESTDKQDVFVARYEQDGSFSWAFGIGGVENDLALGLVAMEGGDFVIAGEFEASVDFSTPPTPDTTISTDAYRSVFVARYNSAGVLQWVKQAQGPGASITHQMAKTPEGDIVVVGEIQDSVSFDGAGGSVTLTSRASSDGFVARFGSGGEVQWAMGLGSDQPADEAGYPGYSDSATAVAVSEDGIIYVAGDFGHPLILGEGGTVLGDSDSWSYKKLFLAALDGTGAIQWAHSTETGTTDGSSSWHVAEKLLPLSDGGLILAGYFTDQMVMSDFGGTPSTLVSEGNFDIFLTRLEEDGSVMWTHSAGGIDPDYIGDVVLGDDSVAVVGTFNATASFPISNSFVESLTSVGSQDVFLLQRPLD